MTTPTKKNNYSFHIDLNEETPKEVKEEPKMKTAAPSYYRQLQALVKKHRNKSATIKANSKTEVLEAWLTNANIPLPEKPAKKATKTLKAQVKETYYYPLSVALKQRPELKEMEKLEAFVYLREAKIHCRPNNSELKNCDMIALDKYFG